MSLDQTLHATARFFCAVGMAALCVMMVVTVADVVVRPFGHSFPGAYELVTFAMRVLVPLTLPYVFWTDANLVVDLLFGKMSERSRLLLTRATSILSALTMAWVTYAVTRRATSVWNSGEISNDLSVPIWIYWVPLVFGCAFSALIALYRSFRPWRGGTVEHAG